MKCESCSSINYVTLKMIVDIYYSSSADNTIYKLAKLLEKFRFTHFHVCTRGFRDLKAGHPKCRLYWIVTHDDVVDINKEIEGHPIKKFKGPCILTSHEFLRRF